MDADLSQRLDRIERQIKVIGEMVIAGTGVAVLIMVSSWIPSSTQQHLAEPWWLVAGIGLMMLSVNYYRWKFLREPK